MKQVGPKSLTYQKNDEHYTPKWIFDALQVTFDLDVAAPIGGVEWIPANNIFTEKDDGLAKEWFGLVWMNPPYSQTTPWIDKFLEHKNGIGLVPVTATRWFRKLWKEADSFLITDERIRFERPGGSYKYIIWETILVGCGEGSEILQNSGLGRMR